MNEIPEITLTKDRDGRPLTRWGSIIKAHRLLQVLLKNHVTKDETPMDKQSFGLLDKTLEGWGRGLGKGKGRSA